MNWPRRFRRPLLALAMLSVPVLGAAATTGLPAVTVTTNPGTVAPSELDLGPKVALAETIRSTAPAACRVWPTLYRNGHPEVGTRPPRFKDCNRWATCPASKRRSL